MAPSAITTTEQYASIILNTEPLKSHFNAHRVPDTSKDLVKDALLSRIADIDTNVCEAGEEDAFFVADMGEVYRQHLRWKMNLKRVKPHYGKTVIITAIFEEHRLTSGSRQMQSRPGNSPPVGRARDWVRLRFQGRD